MTKGQAKTCEILDKAITSAPGTIVSWDDILEGVRGAGCVVRNWLRIRDVLQMYMDDGLIRRTKNIHVEEYEVVANG